MDSFRKALEAVRYDLSRAKMQEMITQEVDENAMDLYGPVVFVDGGDEDMNDDVEYLSSTT